MPYCPTSGILILTICSLNKAADGDGEYDESNSITRTIPYGLAQKLLGHREYVRLGIEDPTAWEERLQWQGVPLAELDFNQGLRQGPDFGGTDKQTQYLPAIDRYIGRFYQSLGTEGRAKLVDSRHHVLILSGLYGLVRPLESIQLYSCPLEPPVAEHWVKDHLLTEVLLAYVRRQKIRRVFDLTAMSAYRNLIDWERIRDESDADVVHCFDRMAAGDYALVPFGILMREYLLGASEEELLALKPETRRGTIVFHAAPESPPGLPAELKIMAASESELPYLERYRSDSAEQVLRGGVAPHVVQSGGTSTGGDWLFAMTSRFQKKIVSMKSLRGQVMVAVAKEICVNPMVLRGDTVKPLTGLLAGNWRYRLGDYRLIYQPRQSQRTVYLIDIGARGSIYEKYERG